jgi:hypothetical protein
MGTHAAALAAAGLYKWVMGELPKFPKRGE